MHPTVDAVTKRIIERSRATRQDYLDRMGAVSYTHLTLPTNREV